MTALFMSFEHESASSVSCLRSVLPLRLLQLLAKQLSSQVGIFCPLNGLKLILQ